MDLVQRLKDAAESGDTSVLYSLIREDPYILERLDGVPYVDTPLHTAARLGHLNFVREILRFKPSFAKKPNQEWLYPAHLATIEGRFKVLRVLLSSERGLARLQGREGKTPLHYAAEKGDLLLLDTILSACPQSMQDVTDRSETALHIAVKFSNFDAFCFLLRKLRTAYHEGSAEEERSILNFQDEEGNTVLHIAVSMNQPQASHISSLMIFKLLRVSHLNKKKKVKRVG